MAPSASSQGRSASRVSSVAIAQALRQRRVGERRGCAPPWRAVRSSAATTDAGRGRAARARRGASTATTSAGAGRRRARAAPRSARARSARLNRRRSRTAPPRPRPRSAARSRPGWRSPRPWSPAPSARRRAAAWRGRARSRSGSGPPSRRGRRSRRRSLRSGRWPRGRLQGLVSSDVGRCRHRVQWPARGAGRWRGDLLLPKRGATDYPGGHDRRRTHA